MKIVTNIDNDKINDLCNIIYDGFEAKFRSIIDDREQTCRIIKEMIDPEMGFYALADNDEVVGVAGTVTKSKSYYKLKFKNILKEFSFLKACAVYIPLKIETMIHVKENEVFIVIFSVKKECRGKGIGTELIRTVYNHFKKNGFAYARLTVVNTNEKAIKLYKRHGFYVEKEIKYGFITEKAGFTSVIHMRKNF